MWIIPSNHPLYSAFVPEFLASKEDWNELSAASPLPLTVKSKPLSVQTWLQGWNRVYWRQHLSGRMLKHSQHNIFTEKYTASLADIHVSHLVTPASEEEQTTPGTFGLISQVISAQFSRTGASSKTLPAISPSDTSRLKENWKEWAIQLRKEYTQRLKLARPIEEKDYLSLQWPTPDTFDKGDANINQKSNRKNGPKNYLQALNWPTPRASPNENRSTKRTPSQIAGKHGEYLATAIGLHDQENCNSTGKSHERLNPAWVAQLMGTTIERIFFVHSATAWSSKPQK